MAVLIFAVTLVAYVIHYRPLDMEGVGSGDVSRYLASGISLLTTEREMRSPLPYHVFDSQGSAGQANSVMSYPNILFQLVLGLFYSHSAEQVDFGYLYAIPLFVRFFANLLIFYLLCHAIDKKWAFISVLGLNALPMFHLYNYIMQGVNTDSMMVVFVLASIYLFIHKRFMTSAMVAAIGYYFRSHMWMMMLSSVLLLSAHGKFVLMRYISVLLLTWLAIRYSLPLLFDLTKGHDAGASFYGGYYYYFIQDWWNFASRVWPVCKDFMNIMPKLAVLFGSVPILIVSLLMKPIAPVSKQLAVFTLMFLLFVILGSVILDFSEPGNRQSRYFVYPFVLCFIAMIYIINDVFHGISSKYRNILGSPIWFYIPFAIMLFYGMTNAWQKFSPNMFVYKAIQVPTDAVLAMTPIGSVMGGIPIIFFIGSVLPVKGSVIMQPNKPIEFYNGENNQHIDTLVLHKSIPFTLGRLPCCAYDNEWIAIVNSCHFMKDKKNTVFERVLYKDKFPYAVFKRLTNVVPGSAKWSHQNGMDCLTLSSIEHE